MTEVKMRSRFANGWTKAEKTVLYLALTRFAQDCVEGRYPTENISLRALENMLRSECYETIIPAAMIDQQEAL